MKEMLRLKRENEELRKENLFLKKAAAFFAKEIDQRLINSYECTNLYEFTTEETLYQKVEEFAYVDHNHVRPHSYNGYRTPYEARTAA